MSDTITKTVRRYGNSGGVYVPNRWIGGRVKVELIEEPTTPRDILNKMPLEHVISAILYGSYARKESTEGSDIDILLIVDDDAKKPEIPIEIKQKYDLQIKSLSEMRNALVHDPIFYKTIKDSGVALINHNFLDSLRMGFPKASDIDNRVEMIESSLKITKEILAIDADAKVIYPIMMRLKEILLIEYLILGKEYSTKALKQEILKSGVTSAEFSLIMITYRAERENQRISESISIDTKMRLISLVEEKIQHVRKKAREKRN